ncbi:MAG: pseudouridine synthase [Elainellaceae cyanobacterium]
MVERLQKLISQWGVASRRKAEQLIADGRVRVNGEPAHLGQKADPHRDRIEVDGVAIVPQTRPKSAYFLLNKPQGVVSTCTDPQNRRTVLNLLPKSLSTLGLHPVGRLDIASTGALLLTNDGNLTFRLTHPRHHVGKTYRVCVTGILSKRDLTLWRQGILLSGRQTLPAEVTVVETTSQTTLIEVILWEGRNRQIRRVADQLGHPVITLHRIAIGSIQLGQLPQGHYRQLSSSEIDSLLKIESSQPAFRVDPN